MFRLPAVGMAALAVAASVACGGGGDTGGKAGSGAAGSPAAGAPAAATPAAPSGSLTEDEITPQLVAFGDSIFKGQAANGICFTCHGQNAEGSALAPNLTDQEWLNIDGSLAGISQVVHQGIPQPKQHAAPMPAFGGVLTEDQIRAVTAYVYSRSHPKVTGGA
jgi:mono/diheme cytochrome c family protein